MGYHTRVLSKDEDWPAFSELAQWITAQHPDFRLSVEEGTEEEWESLLLSGCFFTASMIFVAVNFLKSRNVSDNLPSSLFIIMCKWLLIIT